MELSAYWANQVVDLQEVPAQGAEFAVGRAGQGPEKVAHGEAIGPLQQRL